MTGNVGDMITAAGRPLSPAEHDRLANLETTIERGLATFVEVGSALAEIRDGRLYRQTHRNFTDYCRERWGMDRTHAYRLVDAAEVARNLSPIGDKPLPANEAQARPLASLPPEEQREVWREAVETAPKDDAGKPKVTARHVAEVASKRKPTKKRPRRVIDASNHADNSEIGQTVRKLISAARLVLCIPDSALEGLYLNEITASDLDAAVRAIKKILKLPRAQQLKSAPPNRAKKNEKLPPPKGAKVVDYRQYSPGDVVLDDRVERCPVCGEGGVYSLAVMKDGTRTMHHVVHRSALNAMMDVTDPVLTCTVPPTVVP